MKLKTHIILIDPKNRRQGECLELGKFNKADADKSVLRHLQPFSMTWSDLDDPNSILTRKGWGDTLRLSRPVIIGKRRFYIGVFR